MIEVGEAVIVAVGVAAEVTATDVVAVLLVLPLLATSEYEVVAVGETLIEPEVATAVPLSVTDVADVVLQVRVDFEPEVIEVGEAVMVAVGVAAGAVTDTEVVAVLLELPFLATSEYVVVDVGETVFEPDEATVAPLSVTDVADVVLQVSVELLPDVIEVGEALILADT
ncbi:hypothetical protein [Terriglobus roseus]|uniref:Uncharacterized protein n=1 Tax=Terriglobus roseus TaxID=392734 RepID=A0A1G7GF61_9BACT|nr:hypothetical protein [Terriglobus roseus]SDE86772.1 hypothetical protein SAMN05444167_0675 [Terriglobus roseus]